MKTLLMTLFIFASLLIGQQKTNEYYETFKQLPQEYKRSGELVEYGELNMPRTFHDIRNNLVWKYSWAVPNAEAIIEISDFSKNGVVDFGAYNGYWASLIKQNGTNVVAIDNWTDGKPEHLYYKVTTGSFELLPQHKNKTLLMVFPPRANDMAVTAVGTWGGNKLIYVGEPAPARRTANPKFFEELVLNWKLVKVVNIPQWFNSDDAVYFYERK